MRIYFQLQYRQTKEGIIKATGKNLPGHPTRYSQICRSIQIGYFKQLVNIRTKKILALDVTADEKAHDGKVMIKLSIS